VHPGFPSTPQNSPSNLVVEQDISWEMLSTFTALSPSSQFPNTETLGEFFMCDISHVKVDMCVNHIDTKFGELKRGLFNGDKR
jgi:hypothetical protein